jgi:hypothetical protein
MTLCFASRQVFVIVAVVYVFMTQSGNFWIHPRTVTTVTNDKVIVCGYTQVSHTQRTGTR